MSELENAKPLSIDTTGPKSYLFWGPPGTGKTTLAAAHPGRKFFIDTDDKLGEMENIPADQRAQITHWRHGELLGSAEGITFAVVDPRRSDPYKGFDAKVGRPMGYDKQRLVINELLRLKAGPEPFPYDCIVWDSLTATSDHLLTAIMFQHGATSMTETLWGVYSQNLKGMLDGFMRLPCDRVIIAHDKQQTFRNSAKEIIKETIRPMCYGQLANNIAKAFSEVYYFLGRDRSGKYKIQTAATDLLPARTTKGLAYEQDIDPKLIYADFAKRVGRTA